MDPLRLVAAGEAATGVALVMMPRLVLQLLFGADAGGPGLAIARIAGMTLVALGIACWPDRAAGDGADRGRLAMVLYSSLAAVYLGVLGVSSELRGPLLWPAVVVHVLVIGLLARSQQRLRGSL